MLSTGHYRLWVNGIHHGDISHKNLMYDISEAGEPLGIVNDFDLATWVDHPITKNDRTGTIPFMAIDILNCESDERIPRLYRHDIESFVWVLTYITVANIQYKHRAIEISPPLKEIGAWLRDRDYSDRRGHVLSKLILSLDYGYSPQVTSGYFCYLSVVRRMIRYWHDFYRSLWKIKYPIRPQLPWDNSRQKPISSEPEVDDPRGSLELFITEMEKSLGEDGIGEGFAEVKTLLLEAIRLNDCP